MFRSKFRSLLPFAIMLILITGLFTTALADSEKITVSPSTGLVTTEQGGEASFTVVLNDEPLFLTYVTIQFSSDDESEGTVSPSSVTFDYFNWATPQPVTVTGVDDDQVDGDIEYSIIAAAAESLDPDFNLQDPSDVLLVNRDSEGGPVAQADSAATNPGLAVIIPVLSNDLDLVQTPFTLIIETPPTNGADQVNPDNTVTYTPRPDFVGTDTFAYQVCDSYTRCSTAQVTVEVKPVANPDAYEIGQDSMLTIPPPGLLSNDTTPESVTLTATLQTEPENGSLSLNTDGAFTYTPNQGFVGRDTFTYLLSDGSLNSDATEVTIEVLDAEPPVVEWVNPPVDGEGVYQVGWQTLLLSATARDNVAIQRVHFYRWDAQGEQFVDLGEVFAAPYELQLNAGQLSPEWNEVFVRAYDTAGNPSERQHIWLYQTGSIYLPLITN